MWFAQISFLYAAKISFSRNCSFGTIPCCFILASALGWSKVVSLSLLFFVGSIQVDFPSILCRIIWYIFPLLDIWGNSTVWSVYKVYLGLYIFKKTLRCFSYGRNLASPISCFGSWERTFVDRTPYRWFCMWPFRVYSDSGKCLCKFVTVTSGQVR